MSGLLFIYNFTSIILKTKKYTQYKQSIGVIFFILTKNISQIYRLMNILILIR